MSFNFLEATFKQEKLIDEKSHFLVWPRILFYCLLQQLSNTTFSFLKSRSRFRWHLLKTKMKKRTTATKIYLKFLKLIQHKFLINKLELSLIIYTNYEFSYYCKLKLTLINSIQQFDNILIFPSVYLSSQDSFSVSLKMRRI